MRRQSSILGWHPNAPRHRAFGLTLVPLTLGHVYALERLNSPVLSGESVDLADLLLAIFVCADKAIEAERNFKSRLRSLFFRLWTRRVFAFDLATEASAFRSHIRYWTESPSVIGKARSPDDFGTGWHNRLLAMLTGEVGLGLNDSLALTVRDANALVAALGESRGVMKLWTKRNEEFWQRAAELDRLKFGIAKEDDNGAV